MFKRLYLMQWRWLFVPLIATLALIYAPVSTDAAGGLPSSFFDLNEVSWSSIRNYTSSDYSDYFDDKSADGYLVVDLDILEISGQQRVNAVWQKNVDNRGWASSRNMTSTQFNDKWNELRDDGYRLIDQEAYVLNGSLYYAGVWIENKENLAWASRRNLSSSAFSTELAAYKDAGYIPIDVEAYEYDNVMYYSMVLVDNTENLGWALWRNMSSSTLNSYMSQYSSYRLLDLESYRPGSSQQYAAIWISNPNGRASEMYRDLTFTEFGHKWREMADRGFRVIDQDVYYTGSGVRYAGIWRQNSDRPDWTYRPFVDVSMQAAMNADNIPGAAVAVAQQNEFKYIGGFGHADIDADMPASSWTVFRLASISKAVAGALALDTQEFGTIDLSNGIQTYVPELANDHTYTVEQTITNRSGLGAYSELDEPPDSNDYATALAALGYWNYFTGWTTEFAVSTGSYNYSTHAYTVLGAAIEDVVNTSIDNYINNWSAYYGLGTLQVEDLGSYNPERAQIYTTGSTSNTETPRDNISWKRLGGGMESNVVDITRFAMMLLDDQILTEQSRETMWSRPGGTGVNYGYGWDLGFTNCMDWVGKSGGQRGADSYILVLPQVDVVITVLTNRWTPHDAFDMVWDIGNEMIPDLCAQIPQFSMVSVPDGSVGAAYSYSITPSGGDTPITFALTDGELPPGLTLLSNGTISGTPTQSGLFEGEITATNVVGYQDRIFSIEIDAPPTITSAPPANATLGDAYTHTYTADGDTPISYSVTAGALPDGLTLSGATISGTPTSEGVFRGVVTATNSAGSDTQAFNIVVGSAPERVFPADGDTLTENNASDWPRFSFQHIDGIEWYRIWIGKVNENDQYSDQAVYSWFPAFADVTNAPADAVGICDADSGICTIPEDLWLTDGDYAWWMTYWGPENTEWKTYWNRTDFSVDFAPPTPTFTLIDPEDESIVGAPDQIEWQRDPNVLWYRVWLGTADHSTVVYTGWVNATENCDASTCTLAVDSADFTDGDYNMWVQLWGPDGFLRWAQVNGAPATFTVTSAQ